ncbi:MAG: transposase [Patescibacteria group bacterium]|nr:transposase [Patescibacteria group bacterium]
MRNITFSKNQIYHVYNRGVDKRDIFKDERDFLQFIFTISSKQETKDLKLVEILAYCLMNNHYHLVIRQVAEGGVSKFMHKIGLSHTKYFNGRTGRTGALFESTFKAREIENDSYLFHVFRYIHLNPLKYFIPNWKRDGVKDLYAALGFLKNYRWSSYNQLFSGMKDKTIADDRLIREEFKTLAEYDSFLTDWMKFGFPNNLKLSLQ